MCAYFRYGCCLSSVQCGSNDSVVELVLFYVGDWGVCAAVWCTVSNIELYVSMYVSFMCNPSVKVKGKVVPVLN
jgi:hypothetical protein